jgi:hypothetical protein
VIEPETAVALPSDPEDLYDFLIHAGKSQRLDLQPRVESFLTDGHGSLRAAAIRVLTFYWKLTAHTPTALSLLTADPDPEVREAAAYGLSQAHGDPAAIRALLDVVLASGEEDSVRDAAFHSVLVLCEVPRDDYPWEPLVPGFDAKADWGLLARCLHARGLSVPAELERRAGIAHGPTGG